LNGVLKVYILAATKVRDEEHQADCFFVSRNVIFNKHTNDAHKPQPATFMISLF